MRIEVPKHIDELNNMKDEIKETISCSWVNECKNFGIECFKCKWNSNNQGNYLILDEGDKSKTIRFLEG